MNHLLLAEYSHKISGPICFLKEATKFEILFAANKGGALRFIYSNEAKKKKVISIFNLTNQNELYHKRN